MIAATVNDKKLFVVTRSRQRGIFKFDNLSNFMFAARILYPDFFLAEGENTARAKVDNAICYPVLDENFPRNVNAVTFADAAQVYFHARRVNHCALLRLVQMQVLKADKIFNGVNIFLRG